MQTIKLEVKDAHIPNVLALLNSVKDVMIENIEIKENTNLKKDLYFEERRSNLQQLKSAIDNGTMKMYQEDEFENEIDQYEKDLILKYAH